MPCRITCIADRSQPHLHSAPARQQNRFSVASGLVARARHKRDGHWSIVDQDDNAKQRRALDPKSLRIP